MNHDPEELFAAVAAALGAPALAPEEMAAVLRLAKVMADVSERRFAPVSCYAAGLVIGASASPGERIARLAEIADQVRAAAAPPG